MSFKLRETDVVFDALEDLCGKPYCRYDPQDDRHYYECDRETFDHALYAAEDEYQRLLEHCKHQRDELRMWHERYEGETMDNIDGATKVERIDDGVERTRAEHGITDELRMWAARELASWRMARYRHDEIAAIADRIDAKHESEMQQAHADGLNEQVDFHDNFIPSNYILLPVDADGVPIRLGDTVHDVGGGEPFEVKLIIYSENGHTYASDGSEYGDVLACNCRHVQPDSWERIIKDAIREGMSRQGMDNASGMSNAELVDRCRRLADV